MRSQLLEDGTYPGAAGALAEPTTAPAPPRTDPTWAQSGVADFDPGQSRDPDGRWSGGGASPSGKGPSGVAVPEPTRQPEPAARPEGSKQEGDGRDPAATALRTGLNLLLAPLVARRAVLSAAQMIANLFVAKAEAQGHA